MGRCQHFPSQPSANISWKQVFASTWTFVCWAAENCDPTADRAVDFTHLPVKPVKTLKYSVAPLCQPHLRRYYLHPPPQVLGSLMFNRCLLVPQKRLLPLTSMGPRELGVSIAPKYRIYPLPSTGSEDVTYTESRGLTPKPLDTKSQRRGVGRGVRSTRVRLTCARSLRPNCRKLHHARGNVSTTIHYKIIHGCVRTCKVLSSRPILELFLSQQ